MQQFHDSRSLTSMYMIFTWVGANNGYILAQDEKFGALETQTITIIDFWVNYKILVYHEMR